MAKITVNDIVTVGKELDRLNRYANRHIPTHAHIQEASDAFAEMRDSIRKKSLEVLSMDIRDFHVDTRDMERRLESLNTYLEWNREDIKTAKREKDTAWLAELKESRRDLKDERRDILAEIEMAQS